MKRTSTSSLVVSFIGLVIGAGCSTRPMNSYHLIKKAPPEYRSYADLGPKYSILEDLLLNVDSLRYVREDTLKYRGFEVPASVFRVSAHISLQTGEYEVAEGTADFNLFIGRDESGCIHDSMLHSAYDYWESESASYRALHDSLPAQQHIYFRDGQYVIYDAGDLLRIRVEHSAVYWLDDKVLQIHLAAVTSGPPGLGPTLVDKIIFRIHGVLIRPLYKSYFSPDRFLQMYKQHDFPTKCSGQQQAPSRLEQPIESRRPPNESLQRTATALPWVYQPARPLPPAEFRR